MDYDAALRAITITAAELCGIANRVGSLEAGKDADILLYSGDPLALGAKPDAVLVNGVLVRGDVYKRQVDFRSQPDRQNDRRQDLCRQHLHPRLEGELHG